MIPLSRRPCGHGRWDANSTASMLNVKQFTFSPFGVNTYLLTDSDTQEAAVVDPGMFSEREREEFDHYLRSRGIKITQIINTHMHLDHCFGANYVRCAYGVPLRASTADAPLGQSFAQQCERFGMSCSERTVEIDEPIADGDIISIGHSSVRVIATPGHTPGGVCLYDEADGLLISGDTLFKGSIGRTDLPGGDAKELIRSVRERLMTLPDATTVLPGHERLTNIANERRFNPYI